MGFESGKAFSEGYDQFYKVRDFRKFPLAEKALVHAIVRKYGLKSGCKLLDLGCGTGRYSSLFSKQNIEVIGIDFSKSAIEIAKKKFPNICFEEQNAFSLTYEKASFEVIFAHGFSIFLQEEMKSSSKFLSSMMELLKPGGLFIMINTSTLTDQYTKTNSRINYSTKSYLQMFSEVSAIKQVKTYTLFPQAFIFLSGFAFSRFFSILCTIVTKITGLPLRIYFFILNK